MAEDPRGKRPRDRKPFQKTFGDVMKGIPAGKGGEPRRDSREAGAQPARTGTAPTEGQLPKRGPRHSRDETRRGPVVVRKPPPLGLKKDAGDHAADAGAPTDPAAQMIGRERPPPKTVFRRADGVNLPPREAEGEKTLAPVSSEPPPDAPVEDFAAMYAESEKSGAGPQRFEIGQKVSGRIVKIGQDVAFLDLGGKGEGTIELKELRDSQGELIVSTGEILEGYILAFGGDHGGIVVTKALTKGAQREFLHEARDSGIPIEGLVTGHNKGGLEIDLGGIRGFCPSSQMDVHFVENADAFVGKRLQFRVLELKDRDVVLSRRALLEAEAAKKAVETRAKLAVGAQVEGVVTSLREFGAFVDLGGLEGLVHVSELGWGRVGHPKEVLAVGQTVKVEVVRIDAPKEGEKAERIGLSMKSMQQDPWHQAASSFKPGDRVKGKVVRLQPFGAFVELMPGVDGLVHISALGAAKRVSHPGEVVSVGDEIDCLVEEIDPAQKRIALRRITAEQAAASTERVVEAPAGPPRVGAVHEVTVDKVESFGIFVRFPGGRGLVPNAEMGTVKGSDHRKQFPPGATFKASIVEIDKQGRLRLSKIAAEQEAERAEYRTFMREQHKGTGGKGFGTLGDLLKTKVK